MRKLNLKAANAARKSSPPKIENPRITDSQLRLLSKAEVLERVGGVTFVTLWGWMREGKFPAARSLGGKSVWVEAEVEAWIKTLPMREYKKWVEPA